MASKFQLNFDLRIQNQRWYLVIFWLLVYALVIGQDYLFSELRHTGFYWSEVLLFNAYWLLFIPLSFFMGKLVFYSGLHSRPQSFKILLWSIFVLVLSVLHLFVFTSLITVISNLYFSPPHLFMHTLISSISNDLYLSVLVYLFVPYLFRHSEERSNKNKRQTESIVNKFIVKKDNRQLSIDVSSIYFFNSNKPYVSLHTEDKNYLLNRSLKNITSSLDQAVFIRVHRSTIINKHFIKTVVSRKNGDYDVVLKNDKVLRMSRHYRKNWEQLIESST